eukprot:1182379-Prorocentrum_minimum.AAC.2
MPIHTIPTSHEVTECTACSVQILLPRAGVTGAPAEGCLKDAKEEQAAEEEGQEGESSRPVHNLGVKHHPWECIAPRTYTQGSHVADANPRIPHSVRAPLGSQPNVLNVPRQVQGHHTAVCT